MLVYINMRVSLSLDNLHLSGAETTRAILTLVHIDLLASAATLRAIASATLASAILLSLHIGSRRLLTVRAAARAIVAIAVVSGLAIARALLHIAAIVRAHLLSALVVGVDLVLQAKGLLVQLFLVFPALDVHSLLHFVVGLARDAIKERNVLVVEVLVVLVFALLALLLFGGVRVDGQLLLDQQVLLVLQVHGLRLGQASVGLVLLLLMMMVFLVVSDLELVGELFFELFELGVGLLEIVLALELEGFAVAPALASIHVAVATALGSALLHLLMSRSRLLLLLTRGAS